MRGKEPQEVSCGFFSLLWCVRILWGRCQATVSDWVWGREFDSGEGVRRQFSIGCGEGKLTLGKVSGDSFRLGVGKRN